MSWAEVHLRSIAGKSSGWGRLGCDIALEATDSYALTSIPETLLAASPS